MQETGRVPVAQGTVQLPLDAMSFTSLVGKSGARIRARYGKTKSLKPPP